VNFGNSIRHPRKENGGGSGALGDSRKIVGECCIPPGTVFSREISEMKTREEERGVLLNLKEKGPHIGKKEPFVVGKEFNKTGGLLK